MKRLGYLFAILVLFNLTGVTSAMAYRNKSVVVTNNTAYTMTNFYASPSSSSDWSSSTDLLAGQTLAPGQQITFNLNDGTRHCHYDLMAILYGAAQYAYQYEVNACEGGSWAVP